MQLPPRRGAAAGRIRGSVNIAAAETALVFDVRGSSTHRLIVLGVDSGQTVSGIFRKQAGHQGLILGGHAGSSSILQLGRLPENCIQRVRQHYRTAMVSKRRRPAIVTRQARRHSGAHYVLNPGKNVDGSFSVAYTEIGNLRQSAH